MHVTQEMRQQACEGLLHFTPKKALARELGVSVGSIRDWAIYIQHGVFDWVDKPWVTRRPELLPSASYSGTSNQKPALEPSEWPSKNSPTFLPIVP